MGKPIPILALKPNCQRMFLKKRITVAICVVMKWLNHELHIKPVDTFIDPIRPVNRAIITHGHSDHARAGHNHVLATPQTIKIMRTR